ncbi:hypothetical protein ACGFR8_28270 [Streptomyces brevispora]|uniref:hypothetical protein n=1 Tax=Streptomyces brevispora TaxID=887462 RepID=UPI00371782EB
MSEWAALISAVTAVLGLLLGFFGLPTVVNSPTAKPVRETVTVTATPPPESRGRPPSRQTPHRRRHSRIAGR